MSTMRGTIPETLGVDEMQALPNSDGVNPEPIVLADTEILINDFLSPSRLEEIAGRSDLENIAMMEMVVNTSETTMGNFGSYLPRLKYLKLSNSVIPSVRDLGTSLSHLTVLWMSCCGLHDVDGIASMINLTELYLSYNNIDDISPLAFMDELQVLDLEGNQISDKEQFDYLSMLSKLSTLSISGNPVCQIINKEALNTFETNSFESNIDTITYREFIMTRLPQLKFIDDENCGASEESRGHSSSDRPSTASLAASSHSQEDIKLITDAIKEGLITEEETAAICLGEDLDGVGASSMALLRPPSAAKRRPGSVSSRPSTSTPFGRSLISPSSRPQTTSSGGRGGSAGSNRPETILQIAANAQRPNSSGSGDVTLEDESSTLTFGDVICGNPIKGLRARKNSPLPVLKMLSRNPSTRPATAAAFSSVRKADDFFDNNAEKSDDKNDVLSDLKKWRLMHEQRLKQRSADVQILRINDDTSSEEICLDSDDINSEPDNLEFDNSHDIVNTYDSELELHDATASKKFVHAKSDLVDTPTSSNRAYSPPPKNLHSASLCSSRSSSRSPASPIYSSSQFDSATVPVMRGKSKPQTPTSPDGSTRLVPAPPQVGAPRPRTTTGVRMRRSLLTNSADTYVPLASPMVHPRVKRPTPNKVDP